MTVQNGTKQLFSESEANNPKTQLLARLATVSRSGIPEVSPVGFEFDGNYFWVGTHSKETLPKTRRYRNIIGGNEKVSIVIDDLESVDSWKPRSMKISGSAQVMEHKGRFGVGQYIRIAPKVSTSWGIDPPKKEEGEWLTVKHW